MALEYSITYEQSWVEVHVRGQGDYLSTDKLWKDIVATCNKNNCHTVLGIAEIDVPSAEHAYDHAAIFEVAGLTPEYRIAWVERNQKSMSMAKLTETVVRNRGLATARVFDKTAKAKRWLAKTPHGR